jgi:tetratricopeptide (TPR) repeat protein
VSSESADVVERVGDLIPLVLEEHVPSRRRRSEIMGAVWQDCVETVRRNPSPFAAARGETELRRLVGELVGSAIESASDPSGDPMGSARLRSGCVGTFIDGQLRDLGPGVSDGIDLDEGVDAASEDGEPLAHHPLVVDALEYARRDGNATLQRNLSWMLRRDEGFSYEAIATEAEVPSASVRTGVRRARQAVRRIAQGQRRAVHAPHQGECPPALATARDAWKQGRLDEMASALEAVRPTLAEHPYYLFLLGLHADDTGDRDRATACFERVLLIDDDRSLRAKVLNCLGYIADDAADLELARFYWSRAIEVSPHYTPAQVNQLKNACDRRDGLDLHVCIDRIGELLAGRTLAAADKEYLLTRLAEHPDFEWARSFDAWRRGPARWIARFESQRAGAAPSARAGRAAVLGGLVLLLALGFAAAQRWLESERTQIVPPASSAVEAPWKGGDVAAGSGDRGGHSERDRDRVRRHRHA